MTAAPLWDGTVFFFLSPGPAAITFPARQRPRPGRGLVLCGLFAGLFFYLKGANEDALKIHLPRLWNPFGL